MLYFIPSIIFACHKGIRPVQTHIPHDWVHQPPSNCGVGHCDLSSVEQDIQVALEIATEYAQIQLAEKLEHQNFTVTDEGIVPISEEVLALEHHLLEEHTVVQEAVHVYMEHGVNSMYVLVCTEDGD